MGPDAFASGPKKGCLHLGLRGLLRLGSRLGFGGLAGLDLHGHRLAAILPPTTPASRAVRSSPVDSFTPSIT